MSNALPKIGLPTHLVDHVSEENNGGACALSVQNVVVALSEATQSVWPLPLHSMIEDGNVLKKKTVRESNGKRSFPFGRRKVETHVEFHVEQPPFHPLSSLRQLGETSISYQWGVAGTRIGVRLPNGTFLPLARVLPRDRNPITECPAISISSNVRTRIKSEVESIIVLENNPEVILCAQAAPSIGGDGLELIAEKSLVDTFLQAFDPEVDTENREEALSDLEQYLDAHYTIQRELGIDISGDYTAEMEIREQLEGIALDTESLVLSRVTTAKENRPAQDTVQEFSLRRDGQGGFVVTETLRQPNADTDNSYVATEIHVYQAIGIMTASSPTGHYDLDEWDINGIVKYISDILSISTLQYPPVRIFNASFTGDYRTPGDVEIDDEVIFTGNVSCRNLRIGVGARVTGNVTASGDVTLELDASHLGDAQVQGSFTSEGGTWNYQSRCAISGDISVGGDITIGPNAYLKGTKILNALGNITVGKPQGRHGGNNVVHSVSGANVTLDSVIVTGDVRGVHTVDIQSDFGHTPLVGGSIYAGTKISVRLTSRYSDHGTIYGGLYAPEIERHGFEPALGSHPGIARTIQLLD